MSLQLIQDYHHKVEEILQYGGSRNESAISPAFQNLLEQYCADKKIELIAKLDYKTAYGTTVYPDGTLKDALRQDWGYWESKDTFDSLDDEIQKKLAKGYPTSNILFEDSRTAVLIRNGRELQRASFSDHAALHSLITTFVNYEPQEVRTFREAIDGFKEDLPDLIVKLRGLIEDQAVKNTAFAGAREDFLELCRESINPHIVMADVREMIIQHILTEDIFITVFNESQFHRENNIARSLMGVIETFFTGAVRRSILGKIDPYIRIIKAAAAGIADHHEKQRFLKVVYENFYRAYNPAAADRLGIIYTPNEIVRFMVELHLGYEQADPYPLKRIDRKAEAGKPPVIVKPILKADTRNGAIQLDSVTTLHGLPPAAWEYRLGNRSAIEWILEYHKERKPKDQTIRVKFDTYRFADHKERIIDLLQRVCTVSMKTMNIIQEMKVKE